MAIPDGYDFRRQDRLEIGSAGRIVCPTSPRMTAGMAASVWHATWLPAGIVKPVSRRTVAASLSSARLLV